MNFYIDNPKQARKIGKAGFQLAMEYHRAINRIDFVLYTALKLRQRQDEKRKKIVEKQSNGHPGNLYQLLNDRSLKDLLKVSSVKQEIAKQLGNGKSTDAEIEKLNSKILDVVSEKQGLFDAGMIRAAVEHSVVWEAEPSELLGHSARKAIEVEIFKEK